MATFRIFILLAISLVTFSCGRNQQQSSGNFSASDIKKFKEDADSAYNKNDYVSAAVLFDYLIKLDSTKGEYYFKRGYAFTMVLNATQAIDSYKKAIGLNYRVADSYKNIGINYSTINDSLAIIYLNKSLTYNPTDEKIKKIIGECEMRLKITK